MMKHAIALGLAAFGSLGAGAVLHAHSQSLNAAERAWLAKHNEARHQFGSAPLSWSPALSAEAQHWAITLAGQGQLRHSSHAGRDGTGENLWMGTKGYFSPAQMIGSFVEERRHFVSGRFPEVSRTGNWSDVGHYTQVVWPGTRQVGCAMASNARFDVLVCRYWPAGNLIGTSISPRKRLAVN